MLIYFLSCLCCELSLFLFNPVMEATLLPFKLISHSGIMFYLSYLYCFVLCVRGETCDFVILLYSKMVGTEQKEPTPTIALR